MKFLTKAKSDSFGTFSVRLQRSTINDLAEVRAAASASGFDLPVSQLVDDFLLKIIRNARRELANIGPGSAASAPADAAPQNFEGDGHERSA